MQYFFLIIISLIGINSANAAVTDSLPTVSIADQLKGVSESYGLPMTDFISILGNFMYWLIMIFSFISIIAFIISGIMYLTAAGDESRAETAKDAMKWSIIGVIVGLGAFVIIQAIYYALNGSSLY